MRWTLKTAPNKKKVSQLSNDLSVNPILASLLVQRNIDTFKKAKSFFAHLLKIYIILFYLKIWTGQSLE